MAPTATFNAPGSVSEGSSIALSLTGATDVSSADVAAGFTYAFDCGSGYGAFGASASTTCPTTDDGSRSVGGKVRDKDGGVSTYSATVTITNVAPTASLANDGPDARGEPGHGVLLEPVRPVLGRHSRRVPLRLRLLGGIPGLARRTPARGPPPPTTAPTPTTGRSRPAPVIIDKDGGTTRYTTDIEVTNVAPTVTGPAGQGADEGTSTPFSLGSFSDPGADAPWSVDVDWGDGSAHTSFTKAATGSLGTKSHTYDDNGSYTVTVTVTDKDGDSDSASFTATVANVAPTASLANDGPTPEGSPATVSFSARPTRPRPTRPPGSTTPSTARGDPWPPRRRTPARGPPPPTTAPTRTTGRSRPAP